MQPKSTRINSLRCWRWPPSSGRTRRTDGCRRTDTAPCSAKRGSMPPLCRTCQGGQDACTVDDSSEGRVWSSCGHVVRIAVIAAEYGALRRGHPSRLSAPAPDRSLDVPNRRHGQRARFHTRLCEGTVDRARCSGVGTTSVAGPFGLRNTAKPRTAGPLWNAGGSAGPVMDLFYPPGLQSTLLQALSIQAPAELMANG